MVDLVELKPAEYLWVGSIVYWLTGREHRWAKYLVTVEHPCLNSSKSFGTMLMHLFQVLGKEDPLEMFLGG